MSTSDPASRTSFANFVPPVAQSVNIEHLSKVRLCDVTLREGEQTADAAFTPEQKADLAAQLAALGIPEVQAGYPRQDERAVRLIKQAAPDLAVQVLSVGFMPTWKEDIDTGIDAGADVICILIRSSDAQLDFLGVSREEAVEKTLRNIEYAREQGASTVACAFSFATQADLDFLTRLSRAAAGAGATRIVVPDSMGVARPAAISYIVRHLKQSVPAEIAVHCHNDFGLAVANTLAGLEAGADWAEVSTNGLGERAGNAPLDETVLALRCLYGVELGIRSEGFYALARAFAEALNLPLSPLKAVVGDNAFTQKLDIHVMVAATHPEIFEPFDPELVGNRRWIRLGKGSGPFAVRAKLDELGETATEQEIEELVRQVNARAEETSRAVPDDVVLEMLHAARR